jgi:hypothetical protein
MLAQLGNHGLIYQVQFSNEVIMGDLTEFDDEIADLFGIKTPSNVPNSVEIEDDDEDTESDKNGTTLSTKVVYPVAPKTGNEIVVDREKRKVEASTDYDYSRRSMHSCIEQGNKALTELVQFASTGGPEAYKPVATVMDAITRASKQLLEIQKQMNEIEGIRSPTPPKPIAQTAQNITNNTIIEAQKESGDYTGLTREEAMAKRREMREQRAKADEKQVN